MSYLTVVRMMTRLKSMTKMERLDKLDQRIGKTSRITDE